MEKLWTPLRSQIRWIFSGMIMLMAFPVTGIGQNALTFGFGKNSQGDNTVEFAWLAEPNVVLQRSPTLRDNDWETLLATRGESEFSADRQSEFAMFYRLVSLPDATSLKTTPEALEWRLTEMTINQIDRAVNPQSTSANQQLVPPDDGERRHSLGFSGL